MFGVITQILNKFVLNADPIRATDVWVMLTDLGLSQRFLNKAYMSLIMDPKMLVGIMGCPNEYRKSSLLTLMGYDHEPHDWKMKGKYLP